MVSKNCPPVNYFTDELKNIRNTLCAIKLINDVTKDPVILETYKRYCKKYRNCIETTKKCEYNQFINMSVNKSRDA